MTTVFRLCCLCLLLVGCPAGDDDTAPADDDTGDDDTGDDDTGDDDTDDDDTDDDDTADDDTGDDDTGDDDTEPPVQHVVIAGDSWSTGSVYPTIDALAAWGYPGIAVTWKDTALAGSQASEWVVNHEGKLDALNAALDGTSVGQPPAEILLLYLGGNDLNFGLLDGLGPFPEVALEQLLDDISADLALLIAHAQANRPWLHVVLVDYSYFHCEWMTTLFGFNMDLDCTLPYNQAITALGARKLEIAQTTPRVHYVHNFGILQHTLGVPVTPPWSLPLVDYPAGFFDPPSAAPDYDPFPGGVRRFDIDPAVIPPESLPGPVAGFDDGLHPSAAGWQILIEHTCTQGLCNLLMGNDWS